MYSPATMSAFAMINTMNVKRLRYVTGKILLTIGYSAVVFEWLWLSVIGLPLLIDTGLLDVLRTEQPAVQITPHEQTESSPLLVAAVSITTVVILAITVVILAKLPRTILKGGDAVIAQATNVALPTVTHHKQLPAKRRRELTRRLRLVIELLSAIIPIAILPLLPAPEGLTFWMVMSLAIFLAGVGAISFLLTWLVEPTVVTSRTRSHASRG